MANTDDKIIIDKLQRENIELTLAFDATVEGFARALDMREDEVVGHTRNVTELTTRLAAVIGIQESQLLNIKRGALLHDIGKMGISENILKKAGPLSDDEWVIIRRHPQYAYDLLSPIVYLQHSLDIPYYHHERYDGSGYPHGLAGDHIPLAARVFAVVDVWVSLTSDRPFRKAWPEEKAKEYIQKQAMQHFDPKIAEAFIVEGFRYHVTKPFVK
ncbi:MAG: HD domain-containing phosphohydrolase [Chloroflexota bacterium]